MDLLKTNYKGAEERFEPDFSQQDNFLQELRNSTKAKPPKTKEPEPNPFPVGAFPRPVQDIILATNKSLLFPTDFTGASMLCAASTAIGNTHSAWVKQNWQEGSVVNIALVAPPGSNKSHPLTFAFDPLARLDDQSYHKYALERKEYDLVQGLKRNQRDQSQILEDLSEPVLEKYLVSDFTVEALNKTHNNNPRGICVFADELNGFLKNINRYNSGGELEFWLSAWSGKSINIDRLNRPSIRIKRPFIPIIGTIQNGVLVQLSKDGKAENGFNDRMLFAMPRGIKKERWSEVELDPLHGENWNKYLSNLLHIKLEIDEWGIPIPKSLKFTAKAWERLTEWQAFNSELCNTAESEALQGIYSKLEIYTIRFALILQLMAWSCSEADRSEIELKAVEGAIMLAEYFRKTARVVQRIISKEDPLDRLDKKKVEVYEQLPQSFTTAEGLLVAEALQMPERTFKNFLKDKCLFARPTYGNYEKQL